MTEVYLALGSNVGNSKLTLDRAVEKLGQLLSDLEVAPYYRSHAVGYINQADFINTAVKGRTKLSNEELLDQIKELEKELGRVERFRWGPREIDIDIIFYGKDVVRSDKLTVPHSHYKERDFVLKPILDLTPELKDPVSQVSLQQIIKELPLDQLSIY